MYTPSKLALSINEQIEAAKNMDGLRHALPAWVFAVDSMPEGRARDGMLAYLRDAWFERHRTLTNN